MTNAHLWRTERRSRLGPAPRFSLRVAMALPWTWARRLRQRRELTGVLGLSDHLLKDIGLRRDEIRREWLKPFWTA